MTRAGGMVARIEAQATAVVRGALGLGLIVMVCLNVANALGRYTGMWRLTGADEALVYGMIWIVMLGAILAARHRDHLTIDLLPACLGPVGAGVLRLLTDLATVAVCGFVARHSWVFIDRIGAIGAKSMGLGIPLVLPHSAIFVGFAGMALVAAVLALADLLQICKARGAVPQGGRA